MIQLPINNCYEHLRKDIYRIIQYSGRYFFRLDSHDMDYFFVYFGLKQAQDQTLYIGSCLPKWCSSAAIKTNLNYMLGKIGSPIDIKQVRNKIDFFQYPYSWQFFLTFFIIAVLCTLVLLASTSKSVSSNKLISAFSIHKTNQIFKYKQGSRLNVLNGIRSLAMFWVIFGHSMSMPIGYSQNLITIESGILSQWKFLTVQAGLYAVDVFFFVGGFLVSFSFLKQKSKTGLKYLLAIFIRLLRLWPSYFMAIMLYYAFLPHFGKGPFWQNQIPLMEYCKPFWKPLLFVDNLIDNGKTMCMAWGWYLQCDMQLFIFSILILFIYSRSKFCCYLLIFLSCISNFGYVMTSTYQNGYKWYSHLSDAATIEQYQQDIYYKPWGRCPPYLYGLALGILYCQFLMSESRQGETINNDKNKDQKQEPLLLKMKYYFTANPWKRRLFQLFGCIICLFIAFIPRTNQGELYWPQFVHSIYLTYAKLVFVIGLSFMILPSLILTPKLDSSRTFVQLTMDTKAFNYIAKISFWGYLIHLSLLIHYFGTRFVDNYYAYVPSFGIFTCYATVSIGVGTVFVYLVQAPFSQIQKQLIQKLSKPQSKSQYTQKQKIEGINETIILQKKTEVQTRQSINVIEPDKLQIIR